jgi:hypothetical protein
VAGRSFVLENDLIRLVTLTGGGHIAEFRFRGVPPGFYEVGDIRCATGEVLIKSRGAKDTRVKVRLPAGGLARADQ